MLAGAILIGLAFGLQVVTAGLVILRMRGSNQVPAEVPPVSVLRPVCGLDPDLAETLGSTFTGRAEDQVIFCVAGADDPAIPLLRRVIAGHPGGAAQLLVGEDRVSANPKLNNLVKGWEAARHNWIAMIDSNVLLPDGYVQTLFATCRDDTGLVTSPPLGLRAKGLWAHIEAAFLNSYQDRWQLTADQLGRGFAQGKVLFWRREVLQAAGGPAALGRDLAEDVAATKVVRAAGLKVRVVRRPFPQPLGRRGAAEVWHRQVRWARVRRAGFPALFASEPLAWAFLPLVALVALVASGNFPPVTLLLLPLWYAGEWIMARVAGWPCAAADVCAWMLRDLWMPAVWLAALTARGFVWRGHAMGPASNTQAGTG